jgi:hypothetical protein
MGIKRGKTGQPRGASAADAQRRSVSRVRPPHSGRHPSVRYPTRSARRCASSTHTSRSGTARQPANARSVLRPDLNAMVRALDDNRHLGAGPGIQPARARDSTRPTSGYLPAAPVAKDGPTVEQRNPSPRDGFRKNISDSLQLRAAQAPCTARINALYDLKMHFKKETTQNKPPIEAGVMTEGGPRYTA